MPKMRYGLPYVGNKAKFADEIIGCMPPAVHFYDLFAGGCAISHAALLSGKYLWVHMSDICDTPQLFLNAIKGVLPPFPDVPTREGFKEFLEESELNRIVWAFCSNRRDFPFGKTSAKIMLPLCRMICARNLFDGLDAEDELIENIHALANDKEKPFISKKEKDKIERVLSLNRFGEIRPLERYARILGLRDMGDVHHADFRRCSYESVNIPADADAVIYCDPPYKSGLVKSDAKDRFNHEKFCNWAAKQKNIYISEYEMDENVFVEVWRKTKKTNYNGKGKSVVEKLFIPRCNLDAHKAYLEKKFRSLAVNTRPSWEK